MNISETKKESIIAQIMALKEIITEKLDMETEFIDIDELFND